MSSVTGDPFEMLSRDNAPNRQELQREQAPASSPLPANPPSSPDSTVYIHLPSNITHTSAMRATNNSSDMFAIDTLNETMLRERRQKQLLSLGYPQTEVSRFLSRPCFDRANELLSSKIPSSGSRGSNNPRAQNYKPLQINAGTSSNSWVLLDPYQPTQVLRSLTASSQAASGLELWKPGQEAAFLHMLQYAFYVPPTPPSPTTSSSPDAGASRAVSLAASVTSSTPTEILRDSPAALTKATRTRKHTPAAPVARKSPTDSASDLFASTTCNHNGACSPTHAGQNSADRFLEYNTVSHAVRNRSGFQSRFSKSGEIKTVVYTLNGPRWSDDPTLPQADAILGAAPDNVSSKTEQRIEATKEAKLKLTNKPVPSLEAAKRPSRTSISSKKAEETAGKLPAVKKLQPTSTKTRTRAAVRTREPPFGVFSDSAPRKNSIDAEAEALKRHLSESPSAEEHYESAEEEQGNEKGEDKRGHSTTAAAKGTTTTKGAGKADGGEGSKDILSSNGEVPDSEGSETSELTELDSDEMKTPNLL